MLNPFRPLKPFSALRPYDWWESTGYQPKDKRILEAIKDIIGSNEAAIFDVTSAYKRNAIWEDTARTTPASIDGPAGSIQDELLRYYAEQGSSPTKPVLRRGQVNLLTYSEDFDNAAWTKEGATISSDAEPGPFLGTVADIVSEDSSNGVHGIRTTPVWTTGLTYTYSVFAKAKGRSSFSIYGTNTSRFTGRASFNLVTGVVTTLPGSSGLAGIEAVGDGWWRCWVIGTTAEGGAGFVRVFAVDEVGSNTYTGDGREAFAVWGAQLVQESFPGKYVRTTSAPKSNGDGALWLEGDGTKWLSTSIATPVDDVFAVAAVRRLDTTTSEFFSNRNNAGSDSEGQWALQATGGIWRFVYRRAGGNSGVSIGAVLGTSSIVEGRYTSSDTTGIVALNGVDGSSVTEEKVGTNLTLTLLARNPSGATPFNGRLYHAAMVGANLSAPQRALFRQLAVLRAGVTLP